jgi:aryl-alcohol dehydrogenase-like predicted oxidoreductase
VLPICRELGFVPYSSARTRLSLRAFHVAGRARRDRLWLQRPSVHGENLKANQRLAAKVGEIAEEKGITPAQLALAWVLAQGEDLVPIPRTKRRR